MSSPVRQSFRSCAPAGLTGQAAAFLRIPPGSAGYRDDAASDSGAAASSLTETKRLRGFQGGKKTAGHDPSKQTNKQTNIYQFKEANE